MEQTSGRQVDGDANSGLRPNFEVSFLGARERRDQSRAKNGEVDEQKDYLPVLLIWRNPADNGLHEDFKLHLQVEEIYQTLVLLAKNPTYRSIITDSVFLELFYISKYGLEGGLVQQNDSKELLEKFKGRLTWSIAKAIKVSYLLGMFRVGLYFLPFLAVPTILRIAIRFHSLPGFTPELKLLISNLGGFSCAAIGSILGVIISFMSRFETKRFEDLIDQTERALPSYLRVASSIVVSVIGMILLSTGIINISISGIKSTDILSFTQISFAFGIFAGFSERLIFSKLESSPWSDRINAEAVGKPSSSLDLVTTLQKLAAKPDMIEPMQDVKLPT